MRDKFDGAFALAAAWAGVTSRQGTWHSSRGGNFEFKQGPGLLLGRRLQFVLSRALHAGAAARRGLRLSPPLPEPRRAVPTRPLRMCPALPFYN